MDRNVHIGKNHRWENPQRTTAHDYASRRAPTSSELRKNRCRLAWDDRARLLAPRRCSEIVCCFVELARIHDHERYTVPEAAAELNVSVRKLYRLILRAFPYPPGTLIALARMNSVAQDVALRAHSLGDIARDYGYSNLSNLNRAFLRFTGVRLGLYPGSDVRRPRAAKLADWQNMTIPSPPRSGV
jgi:AraC-like DNA-binding protein